MSRVLPVGWSADLLIPCKLISPRLLHQLVSCCVGLTGRRLVVWVREGEKSLDLSPVLLPTLFSERTGVPGPFSSTSALWLQLLRNHPSTQSSSSTCGPCQHCQDSPKQSPAPFTSSSGVEAVSSIAGNQTAPQLAAGFSVLLLLVTSLKYSEPLQFF